MRLLLWRCFRQKVGPRSDNVVHGEVKAILEALYVAREKQFMGVVIIESDSKTAINLINLAKNMDKYRWLKTETRKMVLECREISSKIGCIVYFNARKGRVIFVQISWPS